MADKHSVHKFSSNKFFQAIKRDLWVLLFDVVAVNAGYYLALLIRFYVNSEFRPTVSYLLNDWAVFAPWYTVSCIVVFLLWRLYGGMWRYAGINDMNRIIAANVCTTVIQVAGTIVFVRRMPITYYAIGAALQFILTVAPRFVYRIITEERSKLRPKGSVNVMLVGIGETSRMIRRQIDNLPEMHLKCFFVCDEESKGVILDGTPVVCGLSRLKEHIKNYKIDRVVLADLVLNIETMNQIKEACSEMEVNFEGISNYLHNDHAGVTFHKLMECFVGEVTVSLEGEVYKFSDREQALMSIIGRHEVRNISIVDNRLFVELASSKSKWLTVFNITNRPEVAMIAEKYGVDRIWIDLEVLGKEDRQKNMNTVKSHHTVEDIRAIRPLLTKSELLVRVNSWHEGSADEIEDVISAGADIIMLPYWKTAEEVKRFTDAVKGRCKTTLLLETKEAVECIDDVLAQGGFDEIHVGLNDLHLSYGMTFMFELLSDGTVEKLCEKFKAAGIPYGFGGIAKLGEGLLPAEKIIMEHYRLGSTRAILSRTFCDCAKVESLEEVERIYKDSMAALREYEASMAEVTQEQFIRNKVDVAKSVENIVTTIQRARSNEA